MPTYSYVCPSCRKAFSELFLSKDEAEKNRDATPCPACGSAAVRTIGNTAFKLEGDGWTRR